MVSETNNNNNKLITFRFDTLGMQNLKTKSLTYFQGERVHEDINSSLMTLNTEPDSFRKLRQVSTPYDNKRYLKKHPVAQIVESCTFKCESGMF